RAMPATARRADGEVPGAAARLGARRARGGGCAARRAGGDGAAMTEVPRELADFLGAPTPAGWLEAAAAPEALPVLLVDHANCEKKAAASALAMLFRYEQHDALTERLSRLAREELRHFEQVRRLMRSRGIEWRRLPAARYAAGLAAAARHGEPGR